MTPTHYGSRHACASRSHSQRGQAALFVVLLLAVGIGLFAYGAASSLSFSQQQEVRTRLAFVQVRDALIGWSAQRTSSVSLPNARPGELPCPDNNNDGFEDGSCVAGAIGRVPWKTLGIPEPKDGAGETLWYAIAGPFRIWGMNGTPINSDTKGNLTVYQDSMATTNTSEAVAVIFAPGPVVPGQIRDAANANNAANYLDTTGGVNNAIAGGPFISTQGSATFNDRLLAITTADLMPVVEQRVARELLALLQSYRAASSVPSFPLDPQTPCNCYTWADNDNNNEGDNDAFRGWLPLGEGDPHDWSVAPPSPAGLGIVVPAWLHQNNWWQVIYYAVAPDETQNKSGGTLTVDGVPGTRVVLITPGPPPPGVPRPVNAPGTAAYWAEYLNDPENSDHTNNIYVRPTSIAYARDRLYTIP